MSQPEDPVPVEHGSSDGDGGAWMVDASTASLHFPSMSRRSPPALAPQPEDPVPVEHDSSDGDGGAWMVDASTASLHFPSMSRRSPPALPPQSEDPVPVEHDSSDGDGGVGMVDPWTASQDFSSLSPPPSAWATMVVVGHQPPSPPGWPTESIQLWEFDDAQQLPQQMGAKANCSAAVLEGAPKDTTHGKRMVMAYLVLVTGSTCLTQAAEELDAVIRDAEKIFLLRDLMNIYWSCGLEIHTNTETGGAMIESYQGNELGDNDAEQTESSRKRPRNSLLVWLHFTKETEQLAAAMRDLREMFLSRGLVIHTNTETGGSSLAMIESYHDDELGDNDAEPQWSSCSQKLQITGSAACAGIPTLSEYNGNKIEQQDKDFDLGDTSSKPPKGNSRTKSIVWLHFTKLPSADPAGVMAECNKCKKPLKANSKNGTSHLLRHLKNHRMDLSSSSETWKEPQRSSCSQKLQNTGSAACAGIPTPSTENNGNELQDKDFDLGDASRKRLKGTSS